MSDLCTFEPGPGHADTHRGCFVRVEAAQRSLRSPWRTSRPPPGRAMLARFEEGFTEPDGKLVPRLAERP